MSEDNKSVLYIGQKRVAEYSEVEDGIVEYVFEDNSRGRVTTEQFDRLCVLLPYSLRDTDILSLSPSVFFPMFTFIVL